MVGYARRSHPAQIPDVRAEDSQALRVDGQVRLVSESLENPECRSIALEGWSAEKCHPLAYHVFNRESGFAEFLLLKGSRHLVVVLLSVGESVTANRVASLEQATHRFLHLSYDLGREKEACLDP